MSHQTSACCVPEMAHQDSSPITRVSLPPPIFVASVRPRVGSTGTTGGGLVPALSMLFFSVARHDSDVALAVLPDQGLWSANRCVSVGIADHHTGAGLATNCSFARRRFTARPLNTSVPMGREAWQRARRGSVCAAQPSQTYRPCQSASLLSGKDGAGVR